MDGLSAVQSEIKIIIEHWIENEGFFLPTQPDCLDFIATEAAEAIDARLRLGSGYLRNNPGRTTVHDIDNEVAQVIFMCLIWFNLREVNAGDVLWSMVRDMDRKRGGAFFE